MHYLYTAWEVTRDPKIMEELATLFRKPVPADEVDESSRFGKPPMEYFVTPRGNFYLPGDAVQDVIATHMRSGHVYDEEVVAACLEYIRPGTAVIDGGTNFGQMTVLFSKATGPDGKVYSFEAEEYVHYILQKNIKANGCANTVVTHGALWDRVGLDMIYPEPDVSQWPYGGYGLRPGMTEGRKVKTLTIDSLAIPEPISLMKLDL
ncbi:MAG: FkbM family methyltransferase, partial [Rhodospirillales bacterium]|nr:FkbM family methyltransferase [Rhodospirillales bacterium]